MPRPKKRSAMIARKTRPPAMTGCTTESGAIAIAATWKTQAKVAVSQPMTNHFEEKRPLALRSGCLMSTVGASHAPRCFHRKPRFVAKAQTSASNMPSCTVKERRVVLRGVRSRVGTPYAHLSPEVGVGLTLETENSSFLDKRHRTATLR